MKPAITILILSVILLLPVGTLKAQELPVTTESAEARMYFREAKKKYADLRIPEAIDLLEKTILADPGLSIAYALQAHLYPYENKKGTAPASRAVQLSVNATKGEQLFAEAVEAYTAGEQKKAILIAGELLQNYPDSWLPTAVLAQFYLYGGGDPNGMQQAVVEGLEYHSELNLLNDMLGNAYRYQRDNPNAEKTFLKNIERHPGEPAPYLALANLYDLQKRYDEAIRYYRLSLESDPYFYSGNYYGSVRVKLARILMDREKWNEAEELLKVQKQLDPQMAEAYTELGDLYLRKEQFNDAVEELNAALKLDPSSTRARALLDKAKIYQSQLINQNW